ncbi:RNA-directed DNA polymerase from mobile element jockey-like [Brachionus plicatilis]|uniref:RNA-directed DNA polymerase from mobile element jockey-like n=1 Tax=Brachionus plicatilis TaxID=10195 RepID=A0A3M7PMJ1_BRAPC|nr:RNA-directed DNA polymerase from mobile element jockey-like [Brachionus plicatilis]
MNTNISAYELRLASNSSKNPKVLYSNMKSKQKVSERIGSLTKKDGSTTTDRCEIAEILNEQFESVFLVDLGDFQKFEMRTEFKCDGEERLKSRDVQTRRPFPTPQKGK